MPIGDWPVVRDPIYGCWLWQAHKDKSGYAIVWGGRTPIQADRVVFKAERGPIAPGLVPDHLCRIRICVCPWHLEPVTKSVNEMRKLWRVRARIKVLPCGHEFSRMGIVTRHGGKVCRCAITMG